MAGMAEENMDARRGVSEPEEIEEVREQILDAAKAAVMHDRNADYDTPERNFGMISEMWSAYLGHQFSPHDVAAMMILVKVARISTSPAKEDHWVDIAGYAACGGEVRPDPAGT
jgi:hypothetical protein